MARVEDVADIIINYMNAEPEPYISNLMLNKLLYFAQGHCLAETGKPLFEEKFEAWKYGPVIPKIYNKYKICGKNSIISSGYVNEEKVLTEEQLEILERVLYEYSRYSATELVSLTHKKGTPWSKARDGIKEDDKHVSLSDDSINEYFQNHSLKSDNFDDLLDQIDIVDTLSKEDYDAEDADVWATLYNQSMQGAVA